MEFIFPVVVIGFIIYLYHASLPSTRYERAEELVKQSRAGEAITIFRELQNKHPKAGLRYIEEHFKVLSNTPATSNEQSINEFERLLSVKNSITNAEVDKSTFNNVEDRIKKKILDLKLSQAQSLLDSNQLLSSLKIFTELKEDFDIAGVRMIEIGYKLANIKDENENAIIQKLLQLLEQRKGIQRAQKNTKDYESIEKTITQRIIELKFNFAERQLKGDLLESAESTLLELKGKHPLAEVKILEIGFIRIQKKKDESLEKIEKELKHILASCGGLSNTKTKSALDDLEQKIRGVLAVTLHKIGIANIVKKQFSLALAQLQEALSFCTKDSIELKRECQNLIAEIHFKDAQELEAKGTLKAAIVGYQNAILALEGMAQNTLYLTILCRQEICRQKQNFMPHVKVIDQIANSKVAGKQELMFRYAYHLAKEGNVQNCESIILKYLPQSDPNVSKLLQFCQKEKIFQLKQKVAQVNKTMHGNNKQELLNIQWTIDDLSKELEGKVEGIDKQVARIKSYTFSKLLGLYFEEGNFPGIIDLIEGFHEFYSKSDLLKNIGIASLRIANNNGLTLTNYENIIANWLTAIHSNVVMVHSLENTSWDDEYQFTLEDSIGSNSGLWIEADNINYDPSSKDNISIGNTQRTLLGVFEGALARITNESLAEKANAFYRSEKAALEKIIHVIESDYIIFASPYFSKKHGLNDAVLVYLECEIEETEKYELIDTAMAYVGENEPELFKQYRTVKELSASVCTAIKANNTKALKKQNTSKSRKAVSRFEQLATTLEYEIIKCIDEVIGENVRNEEIVPMFRELLQLLPSSQQLKHKASQHLVYITIEKVNEGEIEHEDALGNLIEAYGWTPQNMRVIDNLVIVCRILAPAYIQEQLSPNGVRLFKTVKDLANPQLKQALRDTMNEALNEFLNVIQSHDQESHSLILNALSGRSYRPLYEPTLNESGRQLVERLRFIKSLT